MFRTSRFKLMDQGQFWISDSPNTGHYVCYLRYVPMSAALIRQMIGKLSGGLPLIMTGDLNMTDDPHCDVTGLNVFNGYDKLRIGTQSNGGTLVLIFSAFFIFDKMEKIY